MLSAALVLAGVAGPGCAAAASATPAMQQIEALTRGLVYGGTEYRRERVTKVAFEPERKLLGITIDDADETDPRTAIIPLADVAYGAVETGATGTAARHMIAFECRDRQTCITVTRQSFADAVQAGGSGAAVQPGGKSRTVFAFGCGADGCAAIERAIDDLAR